MKELWDIDYKAICEDWDDVYQNKYMEYITQNGLSDDAHMAGVTTAFQFACQKIMDKYMIKFYDLEQVIYKHSSILNKKNKKEKKQSTKAG
jgi:hypothetical protein